MSVNLFVGLHPQEKYVNILFSQDLDETFGRLSWDVSNLFPNKYSFFTFKLLVRAFKLTFEFIYSGINLVSLILLPFASRGVSF